ncbi:hypothetical protein EUGRSUZ_J00135 [Eucalyptus grandis]|uniref:Uncharacterized protein n=2 Tax=Eucalyptus grandis TaxID=71139 RepID=A0ACC3J0M6_EUCGR|nr:hypothetical protein EUGRSUZ_J00135 [Eucalyptus grandis]
MIRCVAYELLQVKIKIKESELDQVGIIPTTNSLSCLRNDSDDQWVGHPRIQLLKIVLIYTSFWVILRINSFLLHSLCMAAVLRIDVEIHR